MIDIGGGEPQDIVKNAEDIAAHDHKKLLDLSFGFDSYMIEAEAGDFETHEPLGWTRNNALIKLSTHNGVPVFELPGPDATGGLNITKNLTLVDFQNLHDFGGVFGGRIALDANDGNLGNFTAFETTQGLNILEADGVTPVFNNALQQLDANFHHNGATVVLTGVVNFDGVTEVEVTDWEGNIVTNTAPEIGPGNFFDFEFHIRDGLKDRIFLYVNGILISNPTFANRNSTGTRNGLVYSSGASNGTNRRSYFRKFGTIINTSEPNINITKEALEASSGVQIIIPNGTRNYLVILPRGLNLPVGYSYKILSQATGKISWQPDIGTELAGTIDGVAAGDTKLDGLREIVRTNILENGAQFVENSKALPYFESLRTGMIAYAGMSLHATPLTVTFGARTMRFVNKVVGSAVIVKRPAVDFLFTEGLNAPDDLGVVHFYENVAGTIFGTAKTDWSTPEQRLRYVYLGNADVNLAKDGFLQANNPLVSAFGLLDTFGDYLAIGGSIKGAGGKVLVNFNGYSLDITGYTAVAWGRNFNNQERPHTPTSLDINDADLHLGYRTSDISMFFGPATKNTDAEQYQRLEDSELINVPFGKYTIQRIYQYPGTSYNMIIYGSNIYDNLDQAIQNAAIERYNLHPSLVPACFLAYLITKQGLQNLDDAILDGTAAILNYDGRTHPSTIGAETSPSNALQAGGELRSMVDQFANSDVDPILFIDFEIGEGSLYGCEWDAVNKTLKNVSQKDMVVNIVPQVGRRETGTGVGLEIFIDSSFDNGNTWHIDDADTYTTYQSIAGQIDSLTASVLIFRVIPNAMIRIGMMLTSVQNEVGIVSHGKGNTNPGVSTSGRYLPSCILTIT